MLHDHLPVRKQTTHLHWFRSGAISPSTLIWMPAQHYCEVVIFFMLFCYLGIMYVGVRSSFQGRITRFSLCGIAASMGKHRRDIMFFSSALCTTHIVDGSFRITSGCGSISYSYFEQNRGVLSELFSIDVNRSLWRSGSTTIMVPPLVMITPRIPLTGLYWDAWSVCANFYMWRRFASKLNFGLRSVLVMSSLSVPLRHYSLVLVPVEDI